MSKHRPQPHPARRAEKRWDRKIYSALYEAWLAGNDRAYHGRARRNPFPPGKRRAEWERGYDVGLADREHDGPTTWTPDSGPGVYRCETERGLWAGRE